jgi:hypothetical protein
MALKEQSEVRQIPGELPRRWFLSDRFDLILWTGLDGRFAGFELCYDLRTRERSIIWRPESGFSHMVVEDGSSSGRHMASPLLHADACFDARRVHSAFCEESGSLPAEVARYVTAILESHPDFATDQTKPIT